MKSEKKIRAKAAAELASLLKDEKAHLAKNRRTRNVIMTAGIACLLIAWAIAGTPWNWTAANAAIAAMLGGFMCGLCMAFDNSMRAWPIIRPLLRDDALDRLKEGTP
jgi:hypothetical protein